MFAVTWQSSNYNENTLGLERITHEKARRTCRTVTGTLTPLSSYMLVIPRFRAMRPVRIEFGDHFGTAFVAGVANFATVELKYLTLADGDRLHSRNIGGNSRRSEGMCQRSAPDAPHHASTADGHVHLRVYFRCDDAGWKSHFAHLAGCVWHGVARTDVSCCCALFTTSHPGQIHLGGINYPRLFSQWRVRRT